MKTLQKSTRKSTFTALTMTIALGFILTGCQKDELATKSDADNSGVSSKANVPDETNLAKANTINIDKANASDELNIAILKIDHLAMKSMQADYSIEIFGNGMVLYEGRRNVTTLGKAEFKASDETMKEIILMMKTTKFRVATDKVLTNDKGANIMDLPMTITTYTSLQEPITELQKHLTKSMVDYNSGYPKTLYSFRTKVENMLNMAALTGKCKSIAF